MKKVCTVILACVSVTVLVNFNHSVIPTSKELSPRDSVPHVYYESSPRDSVPHVYYESSPKDSVPHV